MRAEGAGARKDCGRLLALTWVTGLRAIARCPHNRLRLRLGDGPLRRGRASTRRHPRSGSTQQKIEQPFHFVCLRLGLFGELLGVGGGVLGSAPGFAHGPVDVPDVVAGLPGGLPGPLLLAFGVLKLPGQVGDGLLGLLVLFLRLAQLLFRGGQLRFPVVELLLGFRGLVPGSLQALLLLAATGARGIQIGHLASGFGAAGS